MSTNALFVASEVLQEFRKLVADKLGKQDVPPNIVVVFAAVAANPGRSLKELQEATGLGQAVMSRSCSMLGRGKPSANEPGLGLVVTEEDPTNYSRKIVNLTPKGEKFVAQIDQKLARHARAG